MRMECKPHATRLDTCGYLCHETSRAGTIPAATAMMCENSESLLHQCRLKGWNMALRDHQHRVQRSRSRTSLYYRPCSCMPLLKREEAEVDELSYRAVSRCSRRKVFSSNRHCCPPAWHLSRPSLSHWIPSLETLSQLRSLTLPTKDARCRQRVRQSSLASSATTVVQHLAPRSPETHNMSRLQGTTPIDLLCLIRSVVLVQD